MISGRILIVDDDPLPRRLFADALRDAGLLVESASSAAQALTAIETSSFDVMVTDLRMPDTDGLRLLVEAKRRDPQLDVILVTAVDSVATAVEALKSGAWHYLVKPVAPAALRLDVVRCLERRRMASALDEWRRQAELLEVSNSLSGELEPRRVRQLLLDALMGVASADAGLVIEARAGQLLPRAGRGLSRPAVKELVRRLGRLFTGALPVRPRRVDGHGTASHGLFVPVCDAEGPIAVAALLRPPGREPFDGREARDAAYVAGLVGDALRTADAHASAQRVAVTDALTRLGNAAAIESWLADAERRPLDQPFALLFMDLDRFKAVNDTYGHRVGSRVLAGFGALLREELPEAKLLARFGGDEFVAIVEGRSEDGVAAAERVRARLERHRFVAPGPLDVGVSIGVAAWPDDGVDGGLVLERADAAMYVAKGAGRGRVVPFTRDVDADATVVD